MAQCSVMGVITQVFPIESGVSQKTGNQWQRQQILVKKISNSQFEQFVSLDLSGQNIQKVNPQVGMVGEFFFDAESRFIPSKDPSQQGRWFTSLSCYNCKPFQAQQQPAQPQMAQGGFQNYPPQNGVPQSGGWGQQGPGWNQ